MTAVTLLQTGIIKHLPDPPFGNVDSDRVNSSDTAYRLGVPDGSLSLASLAANIPIVAFGGAERMQTRPWVPLVAALKATGEALAASWYFYQMPAKGKAWCGYCIVGARGKHRHRGADVAGSPKGFGCYNERNFKSRVIEFSANRCERTEGEMKRPAVPDPVRPERKNVDVERRNDNNDSEERPRRQNRGRRGSGPERNPSTRKDRGRS